MRRRLRRAALVVVVLGVALTAVAGVQGVRARAAMLDGREALERGRAAVVRTDLEAALADFRAAADHFGRARGALGGPVLAAASWLPVVGDDVRTVRALAAAGEEVALGGVELAGGALRLPDGVATLAPVDGVIPVRPIAAVAPALERTAALVAGALDRVEAAAPPSGLVGPVAEARQEFVGQVGQLRGLLTAAAALSDALPSFLGADGPRRYFFGAQALGEGRATGGCICAFSVLTVDRGALSFEPFASSVTLTPLPVDAPPPSQAFADRYGRFGSPGQLNSVNYSPDVPTVAEGILNMYEHVRGERLDGVILADLVVLESLVRASGPIEVPGLGTITADEVVEVISNDGYDAFQDSAQRKELMGRVAAETLQAFLTGGAGSDPARAARVLVEAGGQGHLLLYSPVPEEQTRFAAVGLAGPLVADPPAGEPDVALGVFTNGIASNKSDFYVERVVTTDVQLAPDGDARITVTVELTNDTPTSGLPVDVIGPNVPEVVAGENRVLASLYCRPDCTIVGAGLDGQPVAVEQGSEAGHRAFTIDVRTLSGERSTVQWTVDVAGVVDDGDVSLRWADQPTVTPTRLRVDVTSPAGQVVLDRRDFTLADGFHTWQGRPLPVQDLRLQVGEPPDLLSRAWRWLNQPL